jgi:phosphoglycolate phosphatase
MRSRYKRIAIITPYMISKRLYIFDLDGTLVDAYEAIARSLNFTLKKLGYPPATYSQVKRKVGRGDKTFIETFFSKKYLKTALKLYRAHHKKTAIMYSYLRPHAKKMLIALRRRKKFLAIASNRPHYFTNLILKALDIRKYFALVLCADKIKANKPNPRILNIITERFAVKKQEAVFIGDMDIDLETAKRAGIDFIFVKGGSSTPSEVKKYKNRKVISSLKQILSLYNYE